MRSSLSAVLTFILGMALVVAPARLTAQECTIAITSPEEGERVGAQTLVEGTADLPPESHLWVLVAVEGLQGWWPQGNGEAQITDGEWKVLAYIGQAPDVGRSFEIAALAVNDDTHRRLEKWFEDANRSGDYRPMKLPSPFPGCPPETVTVSKTSH